MKFVFFLCVTLAANLPNDAKSWIIKDAISTALEVADKTIDAAIDNARATIAAVKHKTDELDEKVQKIVRGFIQELQDNVENSLEKVEGKVDEVIGAAGPDATECAKFVRILRDTAEAEVANVSHCIIEHLEKGAEYIQLIYQTSDGLLVELKNIKEEAKNCARDVHGVKETTEAVICINKAAFKAGWLTTKKLAKISAYIVELELFVQNLPTSLSKCAIQSGIETLFENTGKTLVAVKDCITETIVGKTTTEKLEISNATKQPENTEQPEIPQLPEVPVQSENTEKPEVPELPEVPKEPEEK